MRFLAVLFANLLLLWLAKGSETNNTISSGPRIYFLKRCSGAGCPYTASWLAHVNLYRRIPWAMESTKMVELTVLFIMCIYVIACIYCMCSFLFVSMRLSSYPCTNVCTVYACMCMHVFIRTAITACKEGIMTIVLCLYLFMHVLSCLRISNPLHDSIPVLSARREWQESASFNM